MTNYKKLKLKSSVAILTAIVIGVVALGFGVVKAYQTFSDAPKVVGGEGGTVNFYEAQDPAPIIQEAPEEPILGSVVSPLEMGQEICANGDCTYYLRQAFDTNTTTNLGRLTVASFADPFLMTTSSNPGKTSGVVLKTDTGNKYSYATAWVGTTSTVELVRVNWTGAAPTTSWEMDCSASSDGMTTSSRAIINTDAMISTSSIGMIQSGITSSTAYGNAGFGSSVFDTIEAGGSLPQVRQILLTPDYPYLVCNIWQKYGDPLDTFFGTWNTSSSVRYVDVRISKQQL